MAVNADTADGQLSPPTNDMSDINADHVGLDDRDGTRSQSADDAVTVSNLRLATAVAIVLARAVFAGWLGYGAYRHTVDVLRNRDLDGDIGSDGSTPQQRAHAAGLEGELSETVAIKPALAIRGIELIKHRYYNPAYLAIMRGCANKTPVHGLQCTNVDLEATGRQGAAVVGT